MKWMSLNDIREKYLAFFESKAHLCLNSFPLIPQNDKSLLLINSGMAPMKKYFTGEVPPPRARVTTCQKCIRTPDIERVGKTARHGTFFEMLGNFSFGDYFKNDATAWAWEFCTEVMEIPADRLWVSIYEDDEETRDIWTGKIGIPVDRIVRLGKADNFWEHGAGPCGPCSEIYFDRGEAHGCHSPDCAVGCDCDRYVEFWNLVFTQFDSDGKGTYTPLAHPNIDTGMGLERLACIVQQVDNLFEVDTIQNIMTHISRIASVTYKQNAATDISLRVITDHIRSASFMIGDGVLPSNEGRGYVLRRLLRRAARHGRILGIREPFLAEVAVTVAGENKSAYPELTDNLAFIQKVVSVEEEAFGRTIDQGLELLNEMIGKATGGVLSGADAFKLYDTYGFPLDLTTDVLAERGCRVETEAFDELMQQQRKRARESRKGAGADAWKGNPDLLGGLPATAFTGYDSLEEQCTVLALIQNGELCDMATGEVTVVLERSPFYAESGGQVGDSGGCIAAGDAIGTVVDVQKSQGGVYLHETVIQNGALTVGDSVTATVDGEIRMATCRNHTAAHLLQAALRLILGDHVQQAGSFVDSSRMRFDFTHFSAMTLDELAAVETRVNQMILSALIVTVREMPIAEARQAGAMALFGEKYGDTVRVVRAGEVSAELCGGTHVDNTAKIGLFKILSESSVAAGVRRIEAVTGAGVMELLNEYKATVIQAANTLKATPDQLCQRVVQIATDFKAAERALEEFRLKLAQLETADIFLKTEPIGSVQLVTSSLVGIAPDSVRTLIDRAKDKNPALVAVIATVDTDKATLVAGCGAEAIKAGAHAGDLVREAAKCMGGGGGGRPDGATAGAKDVSKVDEALAALRGLLTEQVK